MIYEDMTAVGRLKIQVISPDGIVKDERNIKNLVVDTGKAFIAQSMLKTTSNSPAAMTHMAIGTGATAAAAGDTALGGEVGTRVTFSPAASVATNVVTYVGTFLPSNPATSTGLYEAGIFNGSSGGTMLCRTTFAVVNKDPADTLAITWTITINAP
jgi:hypothetical protein